MSNAQKSGRAKNSVSKETERFVAMAFDNTPKNCTGSALS